MERPIGFVRERFWPGRRFSALLEINTQAAAWRDDIANNRIHDVTGKVPSLVFKHEERLCLKPLPTAPFCTDDVDTATVTKSFRVRFDRNVYSVPWRLVGQSVTIRGDDDTVSLFLGPRQVARHPRSWGVGETITHPSHEEGLLAERPRAPASTLPPGLVALGDAGREYFKLLAANGKSIQREVVRLVFLVETFGERHTADAVLEVLKTGHVGADYVEYVMRHKKRLAPAPRPLRLGDPELDALAFREPDLSVYDASPAPKTLDPGDVLDRPETSDETK